MVGLFFHSTGVRNVATPQFGQKFLPRFGQQVGQQFGQ
jgi:hypothetical protein